MSNHSSDSRGPSPEGNRRGGQGRRRNDRGGNRGGNRDGNRGGSRDGNRGGNRGGNNRGGNRSGQGRRDGNGPRRRTPQPAPLTFWQKILKAIGLYDPNKKTKRDVSSRVPQPAGQNKQPAQRREREPRGGSRNARNEQNPVETNRLYVGNLSYDATEVDLSDLFSGVGTVGSVEIVYNRNTHRSKGYSFIEMGSVEEAKRAVETLHDQTFMDRQLIVSGAKSKGPADGGRGLTEDAPVPRREEVTSLRDQEPVNDGPVDEEPSPEPDSEEAA